MSNVPDDLNYTKNDEWARIHGSTATVGITDFAQEQLTDIVFIALPGTDKDLPNIGDEVKAGDRIAIVESVKSTGEIFSPVSGKIAKAHTEIHPDHGGDPGVINRDPYGEGWMVVIENAAPAPDILSGPEYIALIATRAH